ncbi:uncharacterized protein [Physcomitrium patens]|uniref:Methyltransferase domain-containing protein n=1 Tax=Physcomitrium patens TaxID=3218 RepID=A0A2K1J0X4_PHYPA|nr:glutathione S-transferase C-terminal domain-containing protein-like [Physcomitrium patens]PNR35176.1 hypothetical protein PHYPA_023075 [Physcomitrium patens]|eukprot:XP_024402394.1 glutathione S-transferase C-terminal domain-containing protein-like [Physcomitrella patens]
MVHLSTILGFCWYLEHLTEESLMLRASPGREQQCGASSHPGGRCLEPKRTRRQKFRDQGGPSRDSLQRSQIVALLRRIPALHFDRELVSLRNHAELQQFVYRDCRGVARHDERCSEDELSGELPPDVMWPFSAVSELGEKGIFRVDWSVIPATADPFRGFGYKAPALTTRKILRREGGGHRCGGGHYDDTGEGEKDRLGRGARKRSQVESIATALKFLNLSPGSVVVDFGSGSGALSLPLACLFKELTFICVDYKLESLRLLAMRAQAAKLANLTTWQGRIEDYMEPFDACVALHACGHATDLALMQALRWRAGYVASPCCVGKLQFAVASSSFTGIVDEVEKPECSGEEIVGSFSKPLSPKQLEHCLTYPRSNWLRSVITTEDFLLLARTADWSSYDYDSWTSRLHSMCKIMVELDRNLASQDLGYRTSLLALADQKAGAIGVSHILVGKPSMKAH